MISVSYSELDKIISDAILAFDYAQLNLDKLKQRQVFCTLYGAHSLGIGAASPSKLTSIRERKLSKSTRRRVYTVYELDAKNQVICNRIVDNGKIHCSHYHFELDGIRYARSFFGESDEFYTDVVHCMKFCGTAPLFYAEASPSMLYIEYYERKPEGGVFVTCYSYFPKRKLSEKGIPISREAPFGAPDSPVTVTCYEDVLPNLDFHV